jgi:N-hydroxyarylamine O-acetyltransferase
VVTLVLIFFANSPMNHTFLDCYFERIGYTQTPRVDVQTLQELHLRHLQQIPYENLDVFCHQPVRLEREALIQKMLLRRRGGYCFEQNGLFLMVLTELGFKCRANLARVHRNRPEPGGRTHQINLVELDGQIWVCDVGFGGSGFRQPLMLHPDFESEQVGEFYRLQEREVHGFYLLRKSGEAWQPLYTFKIEAPLPIDIEMGNFYASTCPDYVFRNVIMGTRMTARGRVTLLDHTFKCFNLFNGTVETETVTDAAAYTVNLRKYLGVELNDAEQARLRTHFATLKPPESELQRLFNHR